MAGPFSKPLPPNDVLVCLIDKQNLYPDLADAMRQAGQTYGFTFDAGADVLLDTSRPPRTVRHAIILDGHDHPSEITQQYDFLIGRCTSVTLAISYTDEVAFRRASIEIERLKQVHKEVNYLRPSLLNGRYLPAREKLIDNSICDSVRIKYIPVRMGDSIAPNPEVIEYFMRASNLITSAQLYHRAPTDGFISVRAGGEGSFYITATKTDKIELDLERIALVHSYNSQTNRLQYSGRYLPSSDSVEAAILYQRLTWMNSLLHTHASELFTRNSDHEARIAVPPSRYGEAALGHRVADFVDKTGMQDFVIMADHGELFFAHAQNPGSCIEKIASCVERESSRTGREHAA